MSNLSNKKEENKKGKKHVKALKQHLKDSHETSMNIIDLIIKENSKKDENLILDILRSISEDYNIAEDELLNKYLPDSKDNLKTSIKDNNKLQENQCGYMVIEQNGSKYYVNKNEDKSNVYKDSPANIVGHWDTKNNKIILL